MNDRAFTLRSALERRNALVVPGCHDALSAKVIERAGFGAVQVSGFGLAGSLMAKPDVGLVDMKDILDITAQTVRAVEIPVMADIDTGRGNALNAAAATERAAPRPFGALGFFMLRCASRRRPPSPRPEAPR